MDAPIPRSLRGLRHVALKCRHIAETERFYVDLLGYRVEWRPDPENIYLTNGEDSLALHADAAAGAETRLDHIGMMLEAPDDVDAWSAHLGAHGVPLLSAPRTHRDGCRSFYAQDPEGTRIQFLWHPGIALPARP
jgi:catechol 2,3-dioxygenase-like lactoylglutathione lyase family enzyme